ncbi:hypothetical protein [Saccharicrinis aurantiacus]|uniref:hypothetical protein n=1 Tax=Saccharicrinis aurantiacus TaxID=1849719 RepID=UPI00111533CF|nr:hypothetical protein [Saccharicrinis aurantiacus]
MPKSKLLRKSFLTLLIMLFAIITAHAQNTQEELEQLLLNSSQFSTEGKRKIEAAFSAMDAVKKAGAYIESLQELFEDGIVTLPVGIQKGEYELIIQRIKLDEETGKTKIYATCAFCFKDNAQPIAFDGWATLEGKKGLGTNGSLEIIEPIRRGLGDKVTLVFNKGTKVNFGCDGIDSFFANLCVAFTSDKIKPVDATGKPAGQYLATSVQTSFANFDQYTVSLSFDKYFMFDGAKDLIFSLQGGTLDQSDTETPAMVTFPSGYFSGENEEARALWKGLSFSSASVSLPAIFKKPSEQEQTDTTDIVGVEDRITIGVKDFIADNNGLSGEIKAEEIISASQLDKKKWAISIADFSCELLKNEVTGIGFGGDMNLPPLGSNSLLPYHASYNHSEDAYQFEVGIKGKYDFPVLSSTLSLNETSFVEVVIKDNDFYPTINATGVISVHAPISKEDTTSKFNLPDISFQEMCISRDEPYFSVGALGLSGGIAAPEIAGFQLYIDSITPFTNDYGNGLAFRTGVKLSEMFGGSAGLQLYGDYSKWQFDNLNLERVDVNFKSGAYAVKGGVWFKKGDPIYGKGFRGDVKFTIIDKFKLDAVAVFGKKDNYRYFLTDVFTELSPSSGLPFPPALSFYGFGGGLYQRMQQSSNNSADSDFGKSLSGVNYVPDNNVGMGFMASTKFGLVGSSALFNAKVGFEMQFNNSGGLNFIQLRGDAALMNSPDSWGTLADNINDAVKKVEDSGGKIKMAAKSDLSVPANKSGGFLTASLNIKYDIANQVFSADLATYLNAGFIKGVGQNDKMGWASAYFSPDKWYTYIGTPEDRLGVEILNLARSDGYFMVGDEIPELPLPPKEVLQNFSQSKRAQLAQRDNSYLTAGSGLAFGSSFGVKFNATLPPFYARFGVGLGAEFMLKNYGANAYCAGGSTTLGINGWYARAQAWAWVEAGIGMEAKLFGNTKRFEIIDLSASALLAGAGPNPFYFTGAVGGRFNVMGGLISGNCDFDFEIGEECKVMGGSPFGEEVIAQITPSTGEKEVNVFAAPQAVFNIPVGLEMEIEEDDGKFAWYKVTLEEFSITYTDTKQKVAGYTDLSEDGKIYLLDPNDPFESNKDMLVYAKVGFKRKLNGTWDYVKGADGNPVYESKEASFTSGERPKYILPEDVVHSYPLSRQYNYYPNEHSEGYVKVANNYEYLFTTNKPDGCDQKLRFVDSNGQQQNIAFTYKTYGAGNKIRFELLYNTASVSFINNEIYQLALVNVPQSIAGITDNITSTSTSLSDDNDLKVNKQQAEGTLALLDEKTIYDIQFRTSTYNTFVSKMNAINIDKGMTWPEYLGVNRLVAGLSESAQSGSAEIFDGFESRVLNRELNLMHFKPVYEDTKWYTKEIAPLMYENEDLLEAVNKKDLSPGDDANIIFMNLISDENTLSDEAIEGLSEWISPGGSIQYRVPSYVDKDFMDLQTDIANAVVSNKNSSKGISKFLATDLTPKLINGDYEIEVSYTLPGTDIVTSTVRRTLKLNE